MQTIPGMQAIEDSKRFDRTNQLTFGTTTRVCIVVWCRLAAREAQGAQTHAQTPLSNNPLPLPLWSGVCKRVFQGEDVLVWIRVT